MSFSFQQIFTLFALVTAVAVSSAADDKVFSPTDLSHLLTWGPEFTFKIIGQKDEQPFDGAEKELFLGKLRTEVLKSCAALGLRCSLKNGNIAVNEDLVIAINSDPDVIEVQATPKNAKGYELYRKTLQEMLFESAKKIGLAPHRYEGAGHIHLGFDGVMETNPRLFRNFLVDLANHYELGGGVLGENRRDGYGPTFAFRGQKYVEMFAEVISGYDGLPESEKSSLKLAELLEAKLYQDPVYQYEPKCQAINILRVLGLSSTKSGRNSGRTIELRFLRPQEDMHEYLLLLKLFSARIAYLSTLPSDITVEQNVNHAKDIPASEAIPKFRQYVEQTGIPFEESLPLLKGRYLKMAAPKSCRAVFL